MSDRAVRIRYKNYRGEVSERWILPERIWFGSTEWHPDEQWLLNATDLEKEAKRSFALRDLQFIHIDSHEGKA